jgi:hypothetical protein
MRERRREGRIVTMPGVPGYLVHASVANVESPPERRRPLRRGWERIPPRTRRILVAIAWLVGIVALAILISVTGGEGGGGG